MPIYLEVLLQTRTDLQAHEVPLFRLRSPRWLKCRRRLLYGYARHGQPYARIAVGNINRSAKERENTGGHRRPQANMRSPCVHFTEREHVKKLLHRRGRKIATGALDYQGRGLTRGHGPQRNGIPRSGKFHRRFHERPQCLYQEFLMGVDYAQLGGCWLQEHLPRVSQGRCIV